MFFYEMLYTGMGEYLYAGTHGTEQQHNSSPRMRRTRRPQRFSFRFL
jgi:hypothetical protein